MAQCAIIQAVDRVNVQFDVETFEQIRLVAFKARKSIAEVIRQCVQVSLDQVEKNLISEKEKKK
jgi:hypothetical protein